MPNDFRLPGHNYAAPSSLSRLQHDTPRVRNLGNWFSGKYLLVSVSTVFLLVVVCWACSKKDPVQQAQLSVSQFNASSDADIRVRCLAKLLEIPGQEYRARELLDSQNQDGQVALFKVSNPEAINKELVAVVKAFYADLPNSIDGDELLLAMDSSLARLLQDPDARNLSVEIEQWLHGRQSYNNSQYADAVEAFKSAIDLNQRNPGTHLDRALAYVRLGQQVQALDDLTEVIRLNTDLTWKDRAQKVLSADQGLYNALRSQKEKYPTLVALVPTPTQTPTPTSGLSRIILPVTKTELSLGWLYQNTSGG